MKLKPLVVIPVVFILIFLRAFGESLLTQYGLFYADLKFLVDCSIIGCFLDFKFCLLLDIMSWSLSLLLVKTFFNFTGKQNNFIALGFVFFFMLIPLYRVFGVIFKLSSYFIWEENFPLYQRTLYWGVDDFVGLFLSVIVFIALLKIPRIQHAISQIK